MASKGEASHPESIPPEQTLDIDRALVELQEQTRKLTQQVAQVRESTL